MTKDNKQTQNQVQVQTEQQVQVQTLSPQQVMLVRLTEMPLEALQQRIENECLENPWLEKTESDEKALPQRGSEEGAYYQVFASRHGFLPDLSIVDLLFNQGPEGVLWL